jgi:hypothetical protein
MSLRAISDFFVCRGWGEDPARVRGGWGEDPALAKGVLHFLYMTLGEDALTHKESDPLYSCTFFLFGEISYICLVINH